jgi:tetratricopeptide (TPR) repeat protein
MMHRATKLVLGGFAFLLSVSTGDAQPQSGGLPGAGPRPTANIDARREYYFTGKVMMEDGTAPPGPVNVEMICGTGRSQQTSTDAKGKFSFRVGDRQGVMPDVSSGGGDQDVFGRPRNTPQQRTSSPLSRTPVGPSANSLLGCDLHVALAGFRAEDLPLSQHRSMDNPDVGTLILHRIEGVQGTAVSFNSLNAPKGAQKEYKKGTEAMMKRDWRKSQEHFAKAVGLYPNYATAWYQLGIACVQQTNIEQAQSAFSRAMEADPSFTAPYLASAQLALHQKKWQEVIERTGKLISLDAVDYPQAYLLRAMAQGGLNDFDEAERNARQAIRLDTGHHFPRAEYILGFILARKHDYPGATKHMRAYLERAPHAYDVEAVKLEIAQLEKAGGSLAASKKE